MFRKVSDHLRIVQIRDANGNVETIQTTDEHPFWVAGRGWMAAKDLAAGDKLNEADDSDDATVVSSVREEHPEGVAVYNFEVQGDHTYFVEDGHGLETAVWVHNKCGDTVHPSLEDPVPDWMQEGMDHAKRPDSTRLGNKVHYDTLNGAIGEELPTKLANQFPDTEFRFARRGTKGADVAYVGGTHPSEYPSSFWKPGSNHGDFKPDNASGWQRLDQEIRSGKLPKHTQMLPYDDITGQPTWDLVHG